MRREDVVKRSISHGSTQDTGSSPSKGAAEGVGSMRRRSFVASGLGLIAGVATGGLTGVGRGTVARAAQPGPPQGKWISLAPLPEALEEVFGGVANGKLYASQGLLPGFRPAGVMYEYDPGANAWTKKKPMPHLLHHVATAGLNEKLYFFGGFELPVIGPPAWDPVNEAWEYTPGTDSWRALAPMPAKRGAAVAAVAAGKLYIIGGAGPMPGASTTVIRPGQPQRSLDTVEEYDPATNTWRARSPMPTACNHMGAGTVNGKIYVIGGRLTGAFIIAMPGNTDLVQEYDPATDSWATRAPMLTARSGHGAAVLNGRIYVAGGEVETYQYLATFRAFEAYDPAANTWTQLPYMPSPRAGFAMAVMGNRIHVVSGDVQAAMVPPPTGVKIQTDAHNAFEVAVP